MHLLPQIQVELRPLDELLGVGFHQMENVVQILIQGSDLIAVGRMEGQGDHAVDRGQIHIHAAVVIGHFRRIQLLEVAAPDNQRAIGMNTGVFTPIARLYCSFIIL